MPASRPLTLRLAALGFAALVPGAIGPTALAAQAGPVAAQPQFETRLDAALSPGAGLLGGVGVNVRAGWYARVGLGASAGVTRRADRWVATQRADFTARFLFDPFGESRRAFYAGAGLGVTASGGDELRGVLLGVVGMEGSRDRRLVPAAELTLGDGVRLALVLRARRPQGR